LMVYLPLSMMVGQIHRYPKLLLSCSFLML